MFVCILDWEKNKLSDLPQVLRNYFIVAYFGQKRTFESVALNANKKIEYILA